MIAHHEIDINAPLDTVWNLHTDVDAWPAWQTDITAARLDGPFKAGSSFTWTSHGFTVTSSIYAVAERARTLWRGANLGIMGTHEWRFALSPAGVHVITTESWAGDPVDADPTGMQTILDNSLTAWLTVRRNRYLRHRFRSWPERVSLRRFAVLASAMPSASQAMQGMIRCSRAATGGLARAGRGRGPRPSAPAGCGSPGRAWRGCAIRAS